MNPKEYLKNIFKKFTEPEPMLSRLPEDIRRRLYGVTDESIYDVVQETNALLRERGLRTLSPAEYRDTEDIATSNAVRRFRTLQNRANHQIVEVKRK